MARTQFPGTFNTLDVAFRPLPGDRAAPVDLRVAAVHVQRLAGGPPEAGRPPPAASAAASTLEVRQDDPEPGAAADAPGDGGSDADLEESRAEAVLDPLDQRGTDGEEPQSENQCLDDGGLKYSEDYYLGDCQESNDDIPTGKLRHLKDIVDKVVKEHKTFCVEGHYLPIRRAMKKRGWLEKNEHLKENGKSSKSKNPAVISRMLRNISVDFLWTMRCDSTNWSDFKKKQIVNRFPRIGFNTKVGLCSSLQQLYWYFEDGISDTLFPRCYNINNTDELSAFKEDFQMTACISLLKWFVEDYENQEKEGTSPPEGKIPTAAIDFAVTRCDEYISVQNHEDIDRMINGQTWSHQWDQFLTWYYMAVHNHEHLVQTTETTTLMLYNIAAYTLTKMKKYWPQIHLDGILNVWIIKPGANSRGRGIQIMNRMEKILAKVNPTITRETRYVIQKYIERPLLIYNTKFDIRQWFLVTCVQPMTIWMYRESYLRFCSQCFTLLNFHESIHLCNNAVQSKYKNGKRDPKLPDENMWDCYTFQTYLRTLGKAEMWSTCIYPGMCQSIVGALLASQENIDRKNNCFELFGADFILDEAFKPWLIEINSCPSMGQTTSVTARMCTQCLEDVIKVVIDRRTNKRADTGMFELIYKQHSPPTPPYLGVMLAVRGQRICKADIAKIGLYRGGVKRANKATPEESDAETHNSLQESEFLPDDEGAIPENACPTPDNASLSRNSEAGSPMEISNNCGHENLSFELCSGNCANTSDIVKPIFRNIADGVLNLFTDNLLCHEHVFSCAGPVRKKPGKRAKTKKIVKDIISTENSSKNLDNQKKAVCTQPQMKKTLDINDTDFGSSSNYPEDKAVKHSNKLKNIFKLKGTTKHESHFKMHSPVDNKPNSVITPLHLSFDNNPQVALSPTNHSYGSKSSRALTSTVKEKQELPLFKDYDKTIQEIEAKLKFFSHNITSVEQFQKQTVCSENKCHDFSSSNMQDLIKHEALQPRLQKELPTTSTSEEKHAQEISTRDCLEKTSPKITTKNLSLHTEHDSFVNGSTCKNNNATTKVVQSVNSKGLSSPKHNKSSGFHIVEDLKPSPKHIHKKEALSTSRYDSKTKDVMHTEMAKEQIKCDSLVHTPISPKEPHKPHKKRVKIANEINKVKTFVPVQKSLKEAECITGTPVVKNVNSSDANSTVKNTFERHALDTGNLSAARPTNSENTTTTQTQSQIYTLTKNTEDNNAGKLWLHAVKQDDKEATDDIFKRKRLKSNSWKNRDDRTRATEVYNQWRQKLAQTKASCEELLNTLKLFKESEAVTGKPRHFSSENTTFTKNNGPHTRHTILKRFHAEQEPPDSKLRKSRVSTQDVCSGNTPNRLSDKSISCISTLQENTLSKSRLARSSNIQCTTRTLTFVPHYSNLSVDKNSTNCSSRLMLPQIKQKPKLPSDEANASDDPVNEFYAVGMSLKTLQSGITQTENIMLPLGTEHCAEINGFSSQVHSMS